MKRASVMFFQVLVIFVGIGALAFLIWEPTVEGRNVGASLYQIYFQDPFLVFAYTASIALFVGLYQAFKVLGYIGAGRAHSLETVHALRMIKYCALILVGFLVAGEAWLLVFVRGTDDIAGGVAMGLFLIIIFGTTATAARIVEKKFSQTS